MNDREKLIELIVSSGQVSGFAGSLADHLIANGAVFPVRCKDCKHWLKDVAGCTDMVGRCEWANYMVGAVGYCVYGERKDDG